MKQSSFIKINPADSVVVCLRPFTKGEEIEVDGKTITLLQDTPAGHKVLINDASEGTDIIKYGYPIGHAKKDLKQGEWVNENNLKTNLAGTLEYTYNPVKEELNIALENRTFKGYVRKNGEVGTRNEIWVVPTVGCVNGIAERIVKKLQEETKSEGIDAIFAWHHNYGCSQLGDDHENTRKILRDICLHPNAGGVLVLSLGCENNQPEDFMATLGDYDKDRVKLVVTQRVEGDEVEECMNVLRDLYAKAKEDKREDVPVSKLRVGLKCGGSDGFSGITANPLVGELSDWIVAQGGTSILTEVPEMFGAETILMNRCKTPELFEKTVSLINNFKEYFLSHGEPVGENPSPGNKAGGISTLEDKALGCTQKCGRAPVSGVLEYAERLQTTGLNLLSAPGNDLVASTALASSGCQIVLFTTGRGTPFGTFVPTMKISTNSNLYNRKPNWIDFNAGALVEGTEMKDLVKQFIDKVIAIASGEPARNEINGYREISIFKNGVTL
ncbi:MULTISPECIES: UxaA family hydrolase [Segatella]|jgi:altronate hydrolase|uniref:Altronate hydrolase (Altronic acid hydratase) n=2 Tax=Segatella TaxID=2974251 RepID=D8DWR2_9BACT|nr:MULTISPECIES: altronate dehydratase family protein [Segatella]EFI72130.1 altronate hydrolase (Altronic acid hydratase) [Segatella baroniae B14]MDR4931468.1 altronate dehydratase family protein [Segatella bryantii]OYP54736.1 altronate dehydratase [Segatella bryantii]UKK73598.1 altronate dehydratase family protein [Segatella bryantii]UKK78644.1 altronate dehydratase family protein [Segatella baroniae B14]